MFAYVTGGRRESLCAVEPRDVSLGRDPRVRFRVTKNDEPYSVPLGPLGVYVTRQLLGLMKEGQETLFGVAPGTFWSWVHDTERDTGIRVWPHLFRHSYGSDIPANTDPRVWQELMNHQDLSQYRRYRRSKTEREKEAVKVF